jgi:hypothetical protein
VEELLESAGFEVTEIATSEFKMRFADGSAFLRHHFIRLGFLPAWKAIAADGSLEATFDLLEQRLNAIARERGELVMTIPMACFGARRRGA